MKVNWKVRINNPMFWISLVSATLLLVQLVLDLFGVSMDFTNIGEKLKNIINAVFGILTILGVVVDPTTNGVGDSQRALGYEKPWVDAPEDVD